MLRSLIFACALAAGARLRRPAVPGDTDNDGTIDVTRPRPPPAPLFDKLEADQDGTLDNKELKGRIVRREWPAADPDNDGPSARTNIWRCLEAMFKVADKDGEGTLDNKEFRNPAGRKLEKLMK